MESQRFPAVSKINYYVLFILLQLLSWLWENDSIAGILHYLTPCRGTACPAPNFTLLISGWQGQGSRQTPPFDFCYLTPCVPLPPGEWVIEIPLYLPLRKGEAYLSPFEKGE